jgi:surface antigen
MIQFFRIFVCLAFGILPALSIFSVAAYADPPPWAPAHGHRAKHKGKDKDHIVYAVPYGIDHGQCDRGLVSSEVVGGVIGGAVGGVAGAQFGKGRGKTAATIGGTIVGVLVGASIGRSMDDIDQNCVGRVLEHAPDRRRVNWASERGDEYAVIPLRTFQNDGMYCREYQTAGTVGGKMQHVYGTACRQPDGAWKIMH